MKILKELWDTFRKPLLVVGIFGVLFFVIGTVIPAIRDLVISQSPIVGIEATNDKEYSKSSTIKPSDFEIFAKHENGKKTKINDKGIKLSPTKPNFVGAETEVTLTKDKWECTVKVKNKRDKIAEFECGKPNKKDVKATIFNNGELAFTGQGDILIYPDNEYPWLTYQGDIPITSVTFGKEVKPVYMDGFFSGLENLSYVDTLPNSVESLDGAFSECIALKEAPDLMTCTNLLNMNAAFEKSALEKAPKIPASVKNMDYCFAGCVDLKEGADMSEATGVLKAEGLYSGCVTLNKGDLPPNVKIIASAFEQCINLKQMPAIPETVEVMNSTFQGASSMIETSAIPASVQDVSNCFEGCTKIKGTLIVNGNPSRYSGFLMNAATATNIDLQGNSIMLDILAQESEENPNITVNGRTPNYELSYNDLNF